MFITNPNGGVQALDAATGDLLWDFHLPLTSVERGAERLMADDAGRRRASAMPPGPPARAQPRALGGQGLHGRPARLMAGA